MTKFNLEDRLVEYALSNLRLCIRIKKVELFSVLSKQLYRSATSAALNYGEAQSAESRKDFIHKMKLCLKELRESRVTLKILEKSDFAQGSIGQLITETEELVAIFYRSIQTAENKLYFHS